MAEAPWYDELRRQWKPGRVRVLLVGESAPDPGRAEHRFFYAPELHRHDNLFRGVVEAFYNVKLPPGSGAPKRPWLERLRSDGVFLIDLVPYPVNHMSESGKRRERRTHAQALVKAVATLEPSGVVVCHTGVYDAVAAPLRAAQMPLLHDKAIPFPLYAGRAQFPVAVRAAVARLASR